MKKNDYKKASERYFLNEIRQIWTKFPKGEIIENECPDFLIRHDSFVIGIELVNYVRGQSQRGSVQRSNEILWQEIANAAKQEFETYQCEPLIVRFNWNSLYPLKKSEVIKLAHEVKKLVVSNIPTILFEKTQIDLNQFEGTKLDGICHSISIQKMRDSKQSLWSVTNAGFIGVQKGEIQNLIDTKNSKTKDYLKNCDVVWLIIVSEGLQISSSICLDESTLSNTYLSSFDQVIIYDHINKQIIPLKIGG